MANEGTWEIDPTHSSIAFAVKHMMFTTVRGKFNDVKGTIRIDDGSPERSTVEVEIAAVSIDTGVADRDTHLRSADFLDVVSHPALSFRSKRIEGSPSKEGDSFKVVGDLTIRGKTMEVTLDATYEGAGTDPWGKQRRGFRATTEIDRREWGLQWNQALEAGGILVANNVKVELEVQAVKAG